MEEVGSICREPDKDLLSLQGISGRIIRFTESLCPMEPASIGGRMGSTQGEAAVSTPAAKAMRKVGSIISRTQDTNC